MSEEILCEARSRVRSIVDLCEQLGYRRLVQKEPIRTILLQGNE